MGLFKPQPSDDTAALLARIVQLELRVQHLEGLAGVSGPSEQGMDEVLALKAQGKTIEAIKRLREIQPGLGLADAKNLVDQM